MIGSLNRYDKPFWLGVRSERWKVIRRHSVEDGFQDPEVYDLESDPDETNDLEYSEAPNQLRNELEKFTERSDVQGIIEGFVGDPDPDTEERLRQLGYVE